MIKLPSIFGGGKKDTDQEEKKDAEKSAEVIKPKKQLIATEIEKVQAKRKLKSAVKVVKRELKREPSTVVKKARNIGIDVKPPEASCEDSKCPFHGQLSVRGQIIEGVVMTDRMMNSVVVKKEHLRYIPKYERIEKRTRNYVAHNPMCINARVGDNVKIMECRPLSKTKSFVVIEKS